MTTIPTPDERNAIRQFLLDGGYDTPADWGSDSDYVEGPDGWHDENGNPVDLDRQILTAIEASGEDVARDAFLVGVTVRLSLRVPFDGPHFGEGDATAHAESDVREALAAIGADSVTVVATVTA